jgi:hypothetical protein
MTVGGGTEMEEEPDDLRYPKGSARRGRGAVLRIALLWSGSSGAVNWLLGGGDGVVAAVEVLEVFEESYPKLAAAESDSELIDP